MSEKEKEEAAPQSEEPECAEEKVCDELSELKGRVEELEGQLSEAKDVLLRTAAEYDNYRKRTRKELDERYADAKAMTVQKIVPALDAFAKAMDADAVGDDYKKGIEMIYRQFKDALADIGVSEFGAAGEQFDPTVHNAVMHVEDEAFGESEIVEVFQTGYMLGEKVIRHAVVKVAN